VSRLYKVVHSHGITEGAVDTYEEAIERVRAVYGEDAAIGHDGDIADGGAKTLVWVDDATAENDDGSRACCSIREVYS